MATSCRRHQNRFFPNKLQAKWRNRFPRCTRKTWTQYPQRNVPPALKSASTSHARKHKPACGSVARSYIDGFQNVSGKMGSFGQPHTHQGVVGKTIEKGRNIALGCLRNYFTYSTNKRVCTDGLRKLVLTINNKDLILRHRKLRNRTNNLYRQLKNVYFQNQLHAYRRDPKTFWSTITGRQKANHPPPTMQLSSLAEHFKSLLHQPGLTNALPFGPDKEDALCTFTPVTSAEVRTLLKNLVTDKAAGPDGIRPKELKTAAAQISDSLSAFFLNESLASGQLPEEFKSGRLLPIFESGKTNSQKAENYRGISLTCILSKVLESIVHSQLYVTIYNLLARFQTVSMVFDATTRALISLSPQLTTGF